MNGRYYYVAERMGSWFVCFASSRNAARAAGVAEWGRGCTTIARIATDAELESYCREKSIYNYKRDLRTGQTFEDMRRFQLSA